MPSEPKPSPISQNPPDRVIVAQNGVDVFFAHCDTKGRWWRIIPGEKAKRMQHAPERWFAAENKCEKSLDNVAEVSNTATAQEELNF